MESKKFAQRWAINAGKAALALALALSVGQAVRLAWAGAEPGRWVGLDIAWQCWSMCVLGWLALRGRIGLAGWGACAMFGLALAARDPLANLAHPWLLSHALYPPFWGRGNDPQQSPQYARLLLWTILLAGAWARTLAGRRFGRDAFGSISLLGATSVLATSMVFHAASLWIVQQRQGEIFEQARAAMALPGESSFLGFCHATGAVCAQGAAIASALEAMPSMARPQAESSLAAVAASGPGAFASWRQPTRQTFNRLPSMAAAAGVAPGGETRLWVDERALPNALALGERVFAWLALWAHGVWLWGAIGLGAWHEARARSKAADALRRELSAKANP